MGEAAPEHDAPGQVIEALQHGCAGGGEAADGLKQRLGEIGDQATEEERQGTENREDHPGQGHTQEAFAGTQILFLRAGKQLHGCAADEDGRDAHHDSHSVSVAVVQGNQQSGNHGQGFNEQNRAQYIGYKTLVHRWITSLRSEMPLSHARMTTWSPASIWSLPKGTMTLPLRTITATSTLRRTTRSFRGMPM